MCVSDRVVGTIAFIHVGCHDALEIGYAVLDQADRGKGYATEALSPCTECLFSTKEINRLQVSIDPADTASIRVVEKPGFAFEGVMRGAAFSHGAYRDAQLHSLLRSEADCL